MFFTSTYEFLLDAQIGKNFIKIATKPNTCDPSQNNKNTTPSTPSYLQNLRNNQPLLMIPQNYRNTLSTAE